MSASCGCDATFAGLAACHCGKCHRSFADRPAYDAHRRLARPCLHPVAGHGAARRSRLGLGSPRHRVTQDSGGSIVFSRLGHHTGPTRSFARSTIDEVLDRLRIMGGLPKIRTPGAQTGRCARPGIKIVGALVWWGGRRTVSLSKVRRSIATSSIDANIGRFHHCSSTSSSIATSSTSSSIDESAQCAQPGGACLALPCAPIIKTRSGRTIAAAWQRPHRQSGEWLRSWPR